MPLHVSRLRDSDLAAEGDPEACWYAVLLWAASWHQLPAGSLPDNDTVLMRLVGLGRDHRTWKRHRTAALRGFVTCRDGRLYHPVVAEQVREAWRAKVEQRWRTECARVKKYNQRHGTAIAAPTLEEFLAARYAPVPEDTALMSLGTSGQSPPGQALQEIERETGTGTGNIIDVDAREILPVVEPDEIGGALHRQLARVCEAAGLPMDPSRKRYADELSRLRGWLDRGHDLERDILPAVTRTLQALPMDDTIGSLKWIERELFGSRAKAAAKAATASSNAPAAPLVFEKAGEAPAIAAWRAAAASTIGAGPYRNLLDSAALAIGDEGLTIGVSSGVQERQIAESYLFRLEQLTHRFLDRRLTRVEVQR